jgi:hypothetical protein
MHIRSSSLCDGHEQYNVQQQLHSLVCSYVQAELNEGEERDQERDPSSHPVNSVVQALLRSIC